MNIRDALDRIVTIQESLSVELTDLRGKPLSSPLTVAVKRAYRYWPDAAVAIDTKDTPCWINTFDVPELKFNSVMLRANYTIHMALLCYDEDSDVAADIASAFWPAVAVAFAGKQKLNGAEGIWVQQLRGASPTLASFGEPSTGGPSFIGLDLYLDIGMNKAQVMAA